MIRVEIPKGKVDALGHDTLVGNNVCRSLKAAGVPILGVFALRGLTRGRLTWVWTAESHVYEFREADEPITGAPAMKMVRTLKNGTRVWMSGAHLAAEEDEEL